MAQVYRQYGHGSRDDDVLPVDQCQSMRRPRAGRGSAVRGLLAVAAAERGAMLRWVLYGAEQAIEKRRIGLCVYNEAHGGWELCIS